MYKPKQIKRKSGWGGTGEAADWGFGVFFEEKHKNIQLDNES